MGKAQPLITRTVPITFICARIAKRELLLRNGMALARTNTRALRFLATPQRLAKHDHLLSNARSNQRETLRLLLSARLAFGLALRAYCLARKGLYQTEVDSS